MADLQIRSISKSYGGGKRVLDHISLDIRSGEFFTLLGPSGCGKTTLLRIIAGFIGHDEGEIAAGGERLDDKPAHKRDIGMVFQDYAVFPHLTVEANVAFGLKARKVPPGEIATRVADAVASVHLQGLEKRLPSELSGGQQQRVGLARAMVIRPKLLLMDEPLSNLDAKLRVELREEIRDIQQRLGITTVYVTHDQEEALAVSDRIGLMNGGHIEQIGTPFEIYRKPVTRFAATFIGTMNMLKADVTDDGRVSVGGALTALRTTAARGTIELAIRPEHVRLSGSDAGDGLLLDGRVRKVTFLGREADCVVETSHGDIVVRVQDPTADFASIAGNPTKLTLPLARIMAFDAAGQTLELAVSP